VFLFVAIFLQGVLPALLALILVRTRENWPRRRVVLLSALPIPLATFGICAFVFASAAMATKEECGVDACGMAMAAAMLGAMGSAFLYLIGLVASGVAVRLGHKPKNEDFTDVFS
jgi:hypothetical protein